MSEIHRVFLSYRHKEGDRGWLERLKPALAAALGDRATLWSDEDLTAGEQWRQEIRKQIEQATVGVFLASEEFFGSEVIRHEEFGPLLNKHLSRDSGGENPVRLLIVPIGQGFSREYAKTDLELHTVLPPDRPLPESPGDLDRESVDSSVAKVVSEIQRALDKTWVDLE